VQLALESCVELPYVPAGQGEHAAVPPGLYLPATQATQGVVVLVVYLRGWGVGGGVEAMQGSASSMTARAFLSVTGSM
jgi:hypothetical protein